MTAPIPTFEVPPTYYARAVGAGVACAIGGGLLWFVANIIFARIPFLPSLVAIGIGYGTGELISLAVNRKRGTGLAVIAGASVVMALLIGWQFLGLRVKHLGAALFSHRGLCRRPAGEVVLSKLLERFGR